MLKGIACRPCLDTAISCIVIKWIFGSSPKMTLFELIGHPLFFYTLNLFTSVLRALMLFWVSTVSVFTVFTASVI